MGTQVQVMGGQGGGGSCEVVGVGKGMKIMDEPLGHRTGLHLLWRSPPGRWEADTGGAPVIIASFTDLMSATNDNGASTSRNTKNFEAREIILVGHDAGTKW